MGDLTQHRLELLRRILASLPDQGWTRVTSRDLARWLGTTPDTVRKDLSGTPWGTPGAAYEVAELRERLDRVLLFITEPYKIAEETKRGPKGLSLVIEKNK